MDVSDPTSSRSSDRISSERGFSERLQATGAPVAGQPQRVVSSDILFGGTHEIGIAHQGALYRLKITRQGKLILNK